MLRTGFTQISHVCIQLETIDDIRTTRIVMHNNKDSNKRCP